MATCLMSLGVLIIVSIGAIFAAPQDQRLSGIRAEGNRLVNKDRQVVNLRVRIECFAVHKLHGTCMHCDCISMHFFFLVVFLSVRNSLLICSGPQSRGN